MAASVHISNLFRRTLSNCARTAIALPTKSNNIARSNIEQLGRISYARCFSTTNLQSLKEVRCSIEDGVTMIEGVHVPSDREGLLVDVDDAHSSCTLCKLDLNIKYTDVLILSQFLKPDGCILPRRVTGVCMRQHRNLMRLIHQAQRAGLMPSLRPPGKDGKPKTHMKSPYKWKKYNCYFE